MVYLSALGPVIQQQQEQQQHPLRTVGSLNSLRLACERLCSMVDAAAAAARPSDPASVTDSSLQSFCARFSPARGVYLQRLDLSDCSLVHDLSPVSSLTALWHLNLEWCWRVTSLSPLAGLTNVRHLSLSSCSWLDDLSPLSALVALQHLNLEGCRRLADLGPLARLPALQHLNLGYCEKAQWELVPLGSLTTLRGLGLQGLLAPSSSTPSDFVLARVAGLLSSLVDLDLSHCTGVADVEALEGLTLLQRLDLTGCTRLRTLAPLAALGGLQHLNLRQCWALGSLSPLHSLTGLRHLNVLACNIAPGALSSLVQRRVSHGCVEVVGPNGERRVHSAA